jgi:hypothetical protein
MNLHTNHFNSSKIVTDELIHRLIHFRQDSDI